MESNCTLVCGITCDNCPAKIQFAEKLYGKDAPPECKVMIAAIDASRAQENYWDRKREIEDKGILSEVEDIKKRLDSAEGEIKALMRDNSGE